MTGLSGYHWAFGFSARSFFLSCFAKELGLAITPLPGIEMGAEDPFGGWSPISMTGRQTS